MEFSVKKYILGDSENEQPSDIARKKKQARIVAGSGIAGSIVGAGLIKKATIGLGKRRVNNKFDRRILRNPDKAFILDRSRATQIKRLAARASNRSLRNGAIGLIGTGLAAAYVRNRGIKHKSINGDEKRSEPNQRFSKWISRVKDRYINK